MIPQKLVLTAFGAFRERQEIDFTELEQEKLYMICGPTGAGKTTIFDAITFALYGEPSGDLRKSEQLKSDFAGPDELCAVCYTFLLNGKEYYIERSPQQIRRTRRNTETMQNSTALLRLPDGSEIAGPREVNEQVRSLIGLDKEQFRKIVMLPQGEFRKFLESGSDKKQELFRKLFHTHLYDAFTDRLQADAKALREQTDQMRLLCQNDLQTIDASDAEALQTELERETPDYPTIQIALEQALEQNHSRFTEVQKESAQVEQEIQQLQIERAEETNRKLSQKEKLQETLRKLEARSGEIEQLQNKLKFWQQAKELREFYQVWQTEVHNQTRNQQSLHQLQNEQEQLLAQEKVIQEQYKSAQEQGEHLPSLQEENKEIESRLQKFKQIAEYKTSIFTLEKQLAKIKKQTQALALWQDWLRIQEQEHQNQQRIAQLQKVTTEFRQVAAATASHLTAQAEWNDLFHRFWAEQAPKLAATLQDGVPCPVCGSPEHPFPAVSQDGEPVTQGQLNESEQRFRLTMQKLEQVQSALQADWLPLEEAGYLPSYSAEVSELTLSEAIAPFEQACAKLQQEMTKLEKHLTVLGIHPGTEEERVKQEQSLRQKQTAAETELKFITKQCAAEETELPVGSSAEESKKRLEEINQTIQAIRQGLEDANQHKQLWKEKQENLRGRLSSAEKQVKRSHKMVHDSYAAFHKELEKRKFTDEKDFLFWWEGVSGQNAAQQQLQDYQQERHTNEGKLNQLEAELGDARSYDLDLLRQQHTFLQERLQILREVQFLLDRRIAKNTDAKQRLQEHWNQWQIMDKTFREVEHLSQITRGNNPQQLALERYVLAAYFDDIIESANLRLTAMTNGRYTLLRRTQREKGRRPSGLDLDIFDANTGKARHVDTLSGGESFKASLALAWGLADIISQYSGGISIQTLFIDEGFGSLDAEALESAVDCLFQIADSGKMIGIISHVEELKEKIPAKLLVTPGPFGSSVTVDIQT